MKNKILAFDMDGTLTPSRRRIRPEMADLLKKLSKKYILAVLSAGSLELIKKQVLDNIDSSIPIYVFSVSGSRGYYFENNEKTILYEHTMRDDVKNEIEYVLHDMVNTFGLYRYSKFEESVEDRGSQISFSVLGRDAPHELKDSYDPERSKRRKFLDWIKVRHSFLLEYVSVVIGGTTSIDFTIIGHNKGTAIRYLYEKLDINSTDVVYYGDKFKDGGNDFPVTNYCKCVEVNNPYDLYKKLGDIK